MVNNMTLKAGIILINKNKIALIYRNNYNDYSFPKGHLEDGESLIECAIRETEEDIKRDASSRLSSLKGHPISFCVLSLL